MTDSTIYAFDRPIDRDNTGSVKWDCYLTTTGVSKFNAAARKKTVPAPLSMWVADMDFPSPQPVVQALQQRLQHPILGYTRVSEDFREAICQWMRRRQDWSVQPDWIFPVPGVVPALHALVRTFVEPGQGVIVQPPVYYPFFGAVTGNGARIIENPLRRTNDGYRMDFDDLEKKAARLDARMAILCSPHNPVGRVWEKDELSRFAGICQRHGILVVADEIHADLRLGRHPFYPYGNLASVDPAMMVVLNSASKTFNLAGLHTAYVIAAHPGLRKRLASGVHGGGLAGVNPLGATALQAAYTDGDFWLDQLLDYLEGNLKCLRDQLARRLPQLHMISPKGTYLAWIDFRSLKLDDGQLERRLQEKAGVYLDPGPVFGTGGSGFQRLNFATQRRYIKEAVERMAAVLVN